MKNERKKNSLEAMIYPIVTNTISQYGKEIGTGQMWISIVESLDGDGDASKPNVFHSSDYDNIYRNVITKMICDKFGAEKRHKENGNVLIFNDYILKVGKLYGEPKAIETRLVTDAPDAPDAPDAHIESALTFRTPTDYEIGENEEKLIQNTHEITGSNIETDDKVAL